MQTIVLALHIIIAAALIVLVLLQAGKGAEMGAAFGAGASGTVFGARGSASFLSRTTAILAAAFFATSLVLAYMSGQTVVRKSVTEEFAVPAPAETGQPESVPAAPDLPAVPVAPSAAEGDVPSVSPPEKTGGAATQKQE